MGLLHNTKVRTIRQDPVGATDTNGKEEYVLEFAALLLQQMEEGEKHLTERVHRIPGGWRDYRLIEVKLNSLLDRIYGTITTNKLIKIRNQMRNCEVQVHVKAVAPHRGLTVCQSEDLEMIAKAAIAGHCDLCLRDEKAVRKCPLRDALQRVVTPFEHPQYGMCEFSAYDHGMLGDDSDDEP